MNINIEVESIVYDLSFSDISNMQFYNPIHAEFSEGGVESLSVGFNQRFELVDLETIRDKKTKECTTKPVFIKYSPLLDPIRYLLGKYDEYGNKIREFPSLDESNKNDTFNKLSNIHNSSYVDCFFYYLSSRLLNDFHFIHGIDFYGSSLGIHEKFKMNIADDVEHLQSYPIFYERVNKTYYFDPLNRSQISPMCGLGSRSNKDKIKIAGSISNLSVCDVDETDDALYGALYGDSNETSGENITIENVYERQTSSSRTTTNTSNNSSLNYTTDGEDNGDDKDNGDDNDNGDNDNDDDEEEEDGNDEEEDEEEEEDDSDDESSDEDLIIYIKDFPCQLIFLEKCDGTLDELFADGSMDITNASSCMFQIIMTLVVYQKTFKLTHNDLHTNNIMYVNTDITHLVYHIHGKTYKVPTYGKLFKIIDFGRSIYEVNGKTFCSDSFGRGGDGYSQYNFEPFYDNYKPLLVPNMSFDLCRLACSIYDFIIEDESPEEMDLFQTLIYTWCLDDSGKNVLYKKSGEERYPNFKLYKMISRTVHNHIPMNQLENPLFDDFVHKKGKLQKKGEKIVEMTIPTSL